MAGHRLGLLAAAITAVIALAAASPASAFVPRESSSFFGVSSPNFYLMNQKGQDALLNSYLSHIQDTGAGWLRDAVPWPDAEPNPPIAGSHTYRWDTFDSQIARIAQHGLTSSRSSARRPRGQSRRMRSPCRRSAAGMA